MRIRLIVALLILALAYSCHRKAPAPLPEIETTAPQGPLQELAWNAAKLIHEQFASEQRNFNLHILRIQNAAGLPDQAVGYFRSVLEYQINRSGGVISVDGLPLNGNLVRHDDFLHFEFKVLEKSSQLVAGSPHIAFDRELEKTLSYFRHDSSQPQTEDHHVHHKEAEIPTPVAILAGKPLDVSQACDNNPDYCRVVILYDQEIEIVDWKTGAKVTRSLPSDSFLQMRSRAASGKIIASAGLYTIMNNNLSSPLLYDSFDEGPVSGEIQPFLPQPEPGLNTFILRNGHFYDFELMETKGLAVIETTHRLSIASAGSLISANEIVGDSIAVNMPSIYTSSPVFMGERDAVMKFNFDGASIHLQTIRESEGTILDLSITDLNRDYTHELLVTVQRKDGLYIEVWDAF